MIIPEEVATEVDKLFGIAYDYKEDAKQSNASANEALDRVADLLDKEKTKKSIKHYKKVARKAYKERIERIMGDNSTDDASMLVTAVMPKDELE